MPYPLFTKGVKLEEKVILHKVGLNFKMAAHVILIFSPDSFYSGDKGYGIFAPARHIHPGERYIKYPYFPKLRTPIEFKFPFQAFHLADKGTLHIYPGFA